MPSNPVLVDRQSRRPVAPMAVRAADGRALQLNELEWLDRGNRLPIRELNVSRSRAVGIRVPAIARNRRDADQDDQHHPEDDRGRAAIIVVVVVLEKAGAASARPRARLRAEAAFAATEDAARPAAARASIIFLVFILASLGLARIAAA